MTTFITILLSIIALCEGFRIHSILKKPTKKSFYKAGAQAASRKIWDIDFKIAHTYEIKEDIRKERDRLLSQKAAKEQLLEKWTDADGTVDDKKRIEDEIVLKERDIKRFEEQINSLDLQINGERPNPNNPHGSIGLREQADSVRELIRMYELEIEKL